jgi:hypothetical protein
MRTAQLFGDAAGEFFVNQCLPMVYSVDANSRQIFSLPETTDGNRCSILLCQTQPPRDCAVAGEIRNKSINIRLARRVRAATPKGSRRTQLARLFHI